MLSQRNSRLIESNSLLYPNPFLDKPKFTFCLYKFVYTGDGIIHGIIQYVVFCDWLLLLGMMISRFIHVTVCISTLLLLLLNNILLYGSLHLVSSFIS